MATSTDTESSGGSPSVVRRRRGSSDRKRRRAMLVGGIALITVGALVLGWLAWQFWGTNWVSKGRQAEVVADLQEEWGDGQVSAETDFGNATGILRIPRFGEDYQVPILEGSTDEVLAAGVGHIEDTAAVGERGNYALSAHRVTHGEPFADFPELRQGDLVHVETVAADYTYVLDTGGSALTVPFTASWVLDPFPTNPAPGGTTAPGRPGARLITLVTCSELFHTDDRSVSFGHLVDTVAKVP
ncbi:MAG TPA: class E sortase [Nocardioides sp.]|nr:class E sortase [Nocardioides sp.]